MIDELVCPTTTNGSETAARHTAAGPPPALFAGPVDAMLLLAEWMSRQIYWRSAALRNWVKRRRAGKRPSIQVAEKRALIEHLNEIGVVPGSLVMAHTSVSGLSFDPQAPAIEGLGNSLQVAKDLVSLLVGLVGDNGTLVMPTHPVYKSRSKAACGDEPLAVPVYNPESTPCGVGLANELFWRQPGTERSLFPHNSLAARGPLARELLRDHLGDFKPLPHGDNSGYYRFCQRNGLLISVGIPLASCFTLVHAAEEARDENWSVRDFFEDRNYVLRYRGEEKKVTIRKTRTEFMMFSLCIRKLRRDLVRAGILHEGSVGSVRVDWAQSGEIFDFISLRNRSTTYPYFGTSLVSRKDSARVKYA